MRLLQGSLIGTTKILPKCRMERNMDFGAITNRITKNRIGNYEAKDGSAVSVQLRNLIAQHGYDIFKDKTALTEEIQKFTLSNTLKSQLTLVFSCSTLSDFILNSKSDLNMVDIDNVVHSVVSSTGLTYDCAISIIADTFDACGLRFAIEYGPKLVDGTVKNGLSAMMPSGVAEAEIKKTQEMYNKFNSTYANGIQIAQKEQAKNEATAVVNAMNRLCSAGLAEGYYLLGRCYAFGECCTNVDSKKALEYMKIAADKGHVAAAGYLGDMYYEGDAFTRDYTLAHHYYTRPGTKALGKKQQDALKDIYKQGGANKLTMIFSGIVFALMIAFVVFFHEGIFSGSSRLVVGIIMLVLSLVPHVIVIQYSILNKYNGMRWLLMIQFFIWALYAFILVLA